MRRSVSWLLALLAVLLLLALFFRNTLTPPADQVSQAPSPSPLPVAGLTVQVLATAAPSATHIPPTSAAPTAALVPPTEPTAALVEPARPGGHPMGCAAGEIWMDAQDWWNTTPGRVGADGEPGKDFGHLHTGVCFPHQATISGTLTLRVRSVLHKNPGRFRMLQTQIWQGTDEESRATAALRFDPPRTLERCAASGGTPKDAGETCEWWDTVAIDTDRAMYDGEAQIRIRGFVAEPDGAEMRTSTGLNVILAGDERPKYDNPLQALHEVEGRGWYTDLHYARAAIEIDQPGPIAGIWRPHVIMARGAMGAPVTGHFAALDTDAHHGDRGNVLIEGPDEYIGPLTIDTTSLSNGWHRLFLKADAFDPKSGSTHSSVLVVLFEVRN